MLPKLNRLKKQEDFLHVRKSGKVIQENNFGLVTSPTNSNNNTRFGFVVSKKISNSAVTRNKLRRVFREIIREKLEKVNNGYDVIFLVKQRALDSTREEITKEVESALKKGKIL